MQKMAMEWKIDFFLFLEIDKQTAIFGRFRHDDEDYKIYRKIKNFCHSQRGVPYLNQMKTKLYEKRDLSPRVWDR